MNPSRSANKPPFTPIFCVGMLYLTMKITLMPSRFNPENNVPKSAEICDSSARFFDTPIRHIPPRILTECKVRYRPLGLTIDIESNLYSISKVLHSEESGWLPLPIPHGFKITFGQHREESGYGCLSHPISTQIWFIIWPLTSV